MDRIFYFNRLRASIARDNQIVVQGFCADNIMDGMESVVIFQDGDDTCQIPVSWKISKMLATQSAFIKIDGVNSVITFVIDMPKNLNRNAKLVLGIRQAGQRDGDCRVLYKCSGKKIRKYLYEVNSCIDSVVSDGKQLVIKGWAVDKDAIDLTVTEGGRTLQGDACSVEWYSRSDVMESFVECSEEHQAGFVVKIRQGHGRVVISLRAGNRNRVFKLGGLTGTGTSSIVGKLKHYISKTISSLKDYGVGATLERIRNLFKRKTRREVRSYRRWIRKRMPGTAELARQRAESFAYQPLFSILVPLYETEEHYLRELVRSVQAQTYPNWELCLSDGSRDSERLRNIVAGMSEKDKRIRYIAEDQGPLGISENTNQALRLAEGDYIVLGDHDDLFTPDAMYECVKALNEKKADVIYTDEDKTDAKGSDFFEPNFKPDFNIDLLRSNNYICHMFVASRRLVDQVGGFDSEYNGAQDYDFILRCVERAKVVHHIPKVLYRWRSHVGSTAEMPEMKLYAFEAGRRAIEAHYKRLGLDAKVTRGDDWGFYRTDYAIKGEPLISIIIPNKDHIEDLKKCMTSIDEKSTYRNYEYIIVENNSEQEETFAYYRELEQRDNVKVLYWDKEFNYSAINNFGVEQSHGEYVLLLNNDTEMINPDCLEQMLGYCQREDVGAVGARLYYEDGTIQHAGVVIGFGGIAGHAFVGLSEEEGLYQSRTKVACDYSAVTAACLMTKRSVYDQVGGLEEGFKVAFNDIDFCMKIRQTGKLVVYNANAKLYHYESKSRGLEDTPEKVERFNREIRLFHERWPEILEKGDPYYNVNLALDKADFSLRVR